MHCNAEGSKWWGPGFQQSSEVNLTLGAHIFHYPLQVFEGMKAYRHQDGTVVLVEPLRNWQRMANGAVALGMPEIPKEVFMRAVVGLTARALFEEGTDLYIRPVFMGTGERLGLGFPSEYTFFVFACPVGEYFRGGIIPKRLLLNRKWQRAVPGLGRVKCGSNYTLGLQRKAIAQRFGCDEVLYFLQPSLVGNPTVTECGAANVIGLYQGRLWTASRHSERVLPGTTLHRVCALAEQEGLQVNHNPLSYSLIMGLHSKLRVDALMLTGTAAGIVPVGELVEVEEHKSTDEETERIRRSYRQTGQYTFDNGGVHPLVQQLSSQYQGIIRGEQEDTFGWLHRVEPR